MPISWYPGHMHKARKELAAAMEDSQLLVELLDARIPAASSNPLLASLWGGRPRLCILNKADLADAGVTRAWRHYLDGRPATRCLVNGLEDPLDPAQIIATADALVAPDEGSRQALISGIPNVGKSTLLNQIAGRRLARTGNEPAITRHQQRVRLDSRWVLIDTPGLLWPRLSDQVAAHRLAMTGAIRNTAVDEEDIGWFAAETLLSLCPGLLQVRYQLETVPDSPATLLEALGRRRGCLGAGGRVNLRKAAELLLNDYRSGRIGRLSLESPPA